MNQTDSALRVGVSRLLSRSGRAEGPLFLLEHKDVGLRPDRYARIKRESNTISSSTPAPVKLPPMLFLRRLFAATCIAVLAAILILVARALPGVGIPFRALDDTLYDSLYQWRLITDQTHSDVVIVALDQQSLDRMDAAAEKSDQYVPGWPWPRAYWGSAVEYLVEDCGAKAVVFDVLFSEQNVRLGADKKSDDQLFAESLSRARQALPKGLVFASVISPEGDPKGRLSAFRPPLKPPPTFGAINISDDEKWRVYATERYGYPSLAVQAVNAAGLQPKLPTNHSLRLHYYGPHKTPDGRHTFNYISASSVVFASFGDDESKWQISKDMFRGKIVLIGLITVGTYDIKSTPLSPQCPGVEIQATAIENLIHGDQVRELGPVSIGLATLLVSWFASVGVVSPRQWWLKIIAGLLAIGLVFGVATALFVKHNIVWLPLAAPLLGGTLTMIGAFAWSYLGEDQQRRRLLKALSSVVSPTIAEELASDPSKLVVGGTRKEMTVMFTDIAGFTDLSETMPPEKLAPMLNYYLEEMSSIVLSQSGTLDKYIGDAIMSFWNAPLPQEDHAARACRAALRMVQREGEIQDDLRKLGTENMVIYTRLGINSGPMAVGFTGSSHLINYTVLGDAVNLGSRLEGANKMYGTRVMVSETARAMVKDQFVLRQLDMLRVKGKLRPMAVYELIAEGSPSEAQAKLIERYERGLREYQLQHWDAAEKILLEILVEFPQDGPSKAILKRIAHFRDEAPPEDWDGVYVAKDK